MYVPGGTASSAAITMTVEPGGTPAVEMPAKGGHK
jgi:hypothetical protein